VNMPLLLAHTARQARRVGFGWGSASWQIRTQAQRAGL